MIKCRTTDQSYIYLIKHIKSGIQPAPCKVFKARIDEFMSDPPPFFLRNLYFFPLLSFTYPE